MDIFPGDSPEIGAGDREHVRSTELDSPHGHGRRRKGTYILRVDACFVLHPRVTRAPWAHDKYSCLGLCARNTCVSQGFCRNFMVKVSILAGFQTLVFVKLLNPSQYRIICAIPNEPLPACDVTVPIPFGRKFHFIGTYMIFMRSHQTWLDWWIDLARLLESGSDSSIASTLDQDWYMVFRTC